MIRFGTAVALWDPDGRVDRQAEQTGTDAVMNVSNCLKEIARADAARDLTEQDAHDLFAAMLDGGVPDLELGACLTALRMKSASAVELLGFYRAASERTYALRVPPTGLRPLVFGSYGGAHREPNLLPLLVLLLQRIGIPVLLHGTLEGAGRVASVYILRELGVLPSGSLAQAQKAIDEDLLAFVPTAVLCPGLANLLALRSRLGIRNPAHSLVDLLDPFEGNGLRVIGAGDAACLGKIEAFLAATGFDALLLRSTEGEAFANPRQRPRILFYRHGGPLALFGEEMAPARGLPGGPASIEAAATAAWIRQALAGEVPVPHPLVNQLACCLFASGYTDDMNQAKAIAAVEAGCLVPAGRGRGAEGNLPRAAG
jgi:anthranilate phosphoribosyltransferase